MGRASNCSGSSCRRAQQVVSHAIHVGALFMQPDVEHRWIYLQQGAEVGLRYWAEAVNRQSLMAQDGRAIRIDLTVRNWGNFWEACTSQGMQIFERMLLGLEDDGQAMANPYDFIFLPGYYDSSRPAQTQLMTARNLATMAFTHMEGVSLPFQPGHPETASTPPMYELPSAADVPPIVAWSPDLLVSDSMTSTLCGSSTVPGSVLVPLEEEAARTEGCFNGGVCNKFSNVEGTASPVSIALAQNMTIVDMNMPFNTWALGAIDRIVAQGDANQTWMCVVGFGRRALSDPAYANCDSYMEYVATRHNKLTYFYVLDLAGDIIGGADILKSVNPDVVLHCGDEVFFLFIAAAFIAADFHPQAFLTDRPMSPAVYRYLQAFNMNYLMDVVPASLPEHSRPCPVFGTYKGFLDGFQSYAVTHYPDWEANNGAGASPDLSALQAALAGVALTAALMEARTTRSLDAVHHLKLQGVDTFGGHIQFDASGRRVPSPTMLRQLRPVDGRFAHPEERLYKSDSLIVSSEVRDACLLEQGVCDRLFLPDDGLTYPAPNNVMKLHETYPCETGCYMHSTRFPVCSACPRGTYRDKSLISCSPCQIEYFAEFEGSTVCSKCSRGADCSNSSAAPRAIAGFFQTAGSDCAANATATVDSLRATQLSPSICIKAPVICEYYFAACRPTTLCLEGGFCVGSNTGFLCGSCEAASAVHGFRPSRRECSPCPSGSMALVKIYGSFVLLVLLGLASVWIVVRAAQKTTRSNEQPGLCSLRCIWHYIIMLQIVLEASRLDSVPSISNVIAPFTVFYRPLEVVYFKCWAERMGWNEEETLLFSMVVHRLMMPVGAAAWLAIFLLNVFRRETRQLIDSVRLLSMTFKRSRPTSGSEDIQMHNPSGIDYETILRHGSIIKRREYTRQFGTVIHCIIVWIVFCHPIAVRGIVMSQSCVRVHHSEHGFQRRLTLNFEVQCSSEVHKRLANESRVSLDLLGLGLPTALLFGSYMLGARRFIFDAACRHAAGFLTEGYSPTLYFWESICMFRTVVLLNALRIETAIERHLFLLLVLVACRCTGALLKPNSWRFVQAATNSLTTGCVMVVLAGAVYAVERDDPLYFVMRSLQPSKDYFLSFAMLFSAAALIEGAAWTFFKVQAVTLEILMESGNYASKTMFNFHTVVRICGGLNRVLFFKDSGGEYTIDATRLNQRERADMLDMLTELVRACIDSGPFYKSYLMENAVRETFHRAMQARQQRVRDIYSTYGQQDRTQIGCSWCKVMMRQPDIPLIERELPKRPGQLLRSFVRKLVFERQTTKKNRGAADSLSLTIEEIKVAARTVMVDILERQPILHQAPPVKAKKRNYAQRHCNDLYQWEAEPCDTIQADMASRGILLEFGTAPSAGPRKGPGFQLHPEQARFLGLKPAAEEREVRLKPQLAPDSGTEEEILLVHRDAWLRIMKLEDEISRVQRDIHTVRQISIDAVTENAIATSAGRWRLSVGHGRRHWQQQRDQFVAESCGLVDRIDFALRSMEQAARRNRPNASSIAR